MQSIIALGRDLERQLMAELKKDSCWQGLRKSGNGRDTEGYMGQRFRKVVGGRATASQLISEL